MTPEQVLAAVAGAGGSLRADGAELKARGPVPADVIRELRSDHDLYRAVVALVPRYHLCLDCGERSITAVCDPCAMTRKKRGDAWFDRIRADLWERIPDGDWDGAGPGRRRETSLTA